MHFLVTELHLHSIDWMGLCFRDAEQLSMQNSGSVLYGNPSLRRKVQINLFARQGSQQSFEQYVVEYF